MESIESPEDPVGRGPRDHRPAAQELATRGRKRASVALTTTCGDSTPRNHSMEFWSDFKRVRTQPPVEGTVFRDRSNDRDLNFKRPCSLPKRQRRSKKPKAKGNAPTAVNVPAGLTTPTAPLSLPLTPPHRSLAPPPRVTSKAWADYDEEDDRRVYEEDPSTLFTDLDKPLSPCSPAQPLTLFSPSENPLTPRCSLEKLLPSLSSPVFSVSIPCSTSAEPLLLTPHCPPARPRPSEEVFPSRCSPLFFEKELVPSLCSAYTLVKDTTEMPSAPAIPASGESEKKDNMKSSFFSLSYMDSFDEIPERQETEKILLLFSRIYEIFERQESEKTLELLRRWRQAKEKALELLRREDEQSRKQDSDGCQDKNQQDLIGLFRDIVGTEDLTPRSEIWLRFPCPEPSTFSKEFDVKVARHMITGNVQELREETERLHRYEKHLVEWTHAFLSQGHDVSAWVGELLNEMLAEVRKDIIDLTVIERMQECLPSKHCSGLSFSAYRKLKKKMLQIMRLRMDAHRSSRLMFVPYTHSYNALITFGTFYWSSGAKIMRSVAEKNKRKWLRHVHTRRAAITQSRSRRGLKASGHKLCSNFTHYSGLALKPSDAATVPPNSL